MLSRPQAVLHLARGESTEVLDLRRALLVAVQQHGAARLEVCLVRLAVAVTKAARRTRGGEEARRLARVALGVWVVDVHVVREVQRVDRSLERVLLQIVRAVVAVAQISGSACTLGLIIARVCAYLDAVGRAAAVDPPFSWIRAMDALIRIGAMQVLKARCRHQPRDAVTAPGRVGSECAIDVKV